MRHERARWQARIRAVESEYLAVGFSLEWLLGASLQEIQDVANTFGIAEPPRGAIYDAYGNLAATFLIRMFSVFERSLKSYWRSLPGRVGSPASCQSLIDDVAEYLSIPFDLIEGVQSARDLRNRVTHQDLRTFAN
jgi:hypothetical protein